MFATVGTHPAFAQRLKLVLVAGFLGLSLMVGASATAPRVGAEPVGPGGDSFTSACRALQQQEQGLIDQYGQVARANPNDPQLDDIIAQIRDIGLTWQQIGCQAAFGNIASVRVSAPVQTYRPVNQQGVYKIVG